jgi:hypothetical protein
MSFDSTRNIRNIVVEASEHESSGRYETTSNRRFDSNGSYSSGSRFGSISGGNFSGAGRQELNGISSLSGLDIDPRLLEHENPNNCTDLAAPLPLDQYRLHVDNNPRVVKLKPYERIKHLQEIAVRYLKPPPLPRSGDIVIQQLPSRQVAPAPPLVIREPSARPPTPPPMIVREAPPEPPQPLPGKIITIPGKIIPPPARKVIVEKMAPIPAKPQNILIERWLPYGPQTQRVIFQQSEKTCIIPDPNNVIIEHQNPEVDLQKEVKNLGIQEADPRDYVSRYGSSLVRTEQLPEVAISYSNQAASHLRTESHRVHQEDLILEGDIQALKLIDLDQHGLGYLRNKISNSPGFNKPAYKF